MNPYLPAQPVGPGDWRASAVCRQVDPELMHPEPGQPRAWADARAICSRCPVRTACLDAALTEEDTSSARSRYGVRGGLTPRQRWREAERRGIRTAQPAT